jgi:uncharacterized protein (TIGR02145 family)
VQGLQKSKIMKRAVFVFSLVSMVTAMSFANAGNRKGDQAIFDLDKEEMATTDESVLIEVVEIGDQVWMKNNLNTSVFANGDRIPIFSNYDELMALGRNFNPGAANIENKPELSDSLGMLYNWYAVSDPRGLCPIGFRIPTHEDFGELLDFVYENFNGKKGLEKALGESGFGIGYAGWCCMDFMDDDGVIIDFANIGYNAAYWTSSEIIEDWDNEDGHSWILDIGTTWRTDSSGVYFNNQPHNRAFSVICIQE